MGALKSLSSKSVFYLLVINLYDTHIPTPLTLLVQSSSCCDHFYVFLPFQCCRLCWYRGTASLTPSIQCCLASVTLYNRTSRTCPRTPPSQSPLLRPTQCLFLIRQEAAAVAPSLIRHPALTLAVHSRCQVRASSKYLLTVICFFYSEQQNSLVCSLFFFLPDQRLHLLPTCPQRSRWLRIAPNQWTPTSWLHLCL